MSAEGQTLLRLLQRGDFTLRRIPSSYIIESDKDFRLFFRLLHELDETEHDEMGRRTCHVNGSVGGRQGSIKNIRIKLS